MMLSYLPRQTKIRRQYYTAVILAKAAASGIASPSPLLDFGAERPQPFHPLALFGGFLGGAEHRIVGVVDKSLVALGRHRLGVVDRALDIVAPYLARQFVEHLDAVTVGIDDVEAVRHAVVDPALELDAPGAQP